MNKTVTAASDIHGSWDEMSHPPEANLLVFAGDVTSNGKLQNAMAFLQWAEQFVPYFDDVILTPGNHDECFEVSGPLLAEEGGSRGIDVLIDAGMDAHGIRVWGTPWSLTYGSWSFMGSEEFLAQKYAGIPEDTQLLISHGPPYGILDLVARGELTGSKSLLAVVNQLQHLRAFVCGHIHESRGRHVLESDCMAYNVASLDRHYRLRVGDEWTNFVM